MIVRDEEKNIGRCLASVDGCFDEIVVVDTGSVDKTKDIAASFGAKIHDFKWVDDFSAARNFSFSKAHSDFVMWLDADDVMKPEEIEAIKALKSKLGEKADVYFMKYDYAQDANGNSTYIFSRERIVRNTGEAKWVAPIHECMMYPSSWKKEFTDITVTHRRSAEDCAKDSSRNIPLLRKAVVQYPKDNRLQFYFARELVIAGLSEEAISVFEDYLKKDDWHDNRVNAHMSLAEAHLKCNRPEKAIEVCLKGILLDPRWAEFFVTIGQVYYDRKDWPKAAFWFETASRCKVPETKGFVNLDYYNWMPYDRLCICYWEMGERLKSYEANEKALSYKPTEARLLKNREVMKDILFPEGRGDASRPRVDIIIPTYNNLEYLRLCIESVRRRTTDWPHSLFVVDSGDDGTGEWLRKQSDITVISSKMRLTYAEAVNLGIRSTSAKYVLLLNNDTIVSDRWLSAMMVEAMKPGVGVVGPLSNCDKGWSHEEKIVVNGVELKTSATIEDVANLIPGIETFSHPKRVTERFWIPFYAALLPREALDKVGVLDENFKNGHEDYDYCMRLKKSGYRIINTYDSFVFHFSMKTPRPGPLGEITERNVSVVNTKYSKPVFTLFTGKAWEPWNGSSLENEGLGGSETAAIYIARAFEKKGYRSVIFGDCAGLEGVVDGVEYVDSKHFARWVASTHMNIFVSCRRPSVFSEAIRADWKGCFATDTEFHEKEIHLDKYDRMIAISTAQAQLLVDKYGIPAEKMHVSRCGVDLDRFNQIVPRQKGKLIYTSGPNRGLDILLKLFPKIRKEFPEATLHVFYGFNYLEAEAQEKKDAAISKSIEKLKKSFEQPGVVFHGRVPLPKLTQEILSASLWAYPTFFHENFCISAVEAMAAGVPVITTDYAAFPTTVGDAGILIPGDPNTEIYQKRFVEECLLMLKDENRWKTYSRRGRERARLFPWSSIADEWLEVIEKDLKAKEVNSGTA